MGYNCIIYPVSTLRIAMKAIDGFFTELKEKGTQKDCIDKMQSRKELYELLRYTPGEEWHFPENEKKN
jgi:methylisocitrate lyase